MNLIRSATREVMLRALVATALIVAILIVASVSGARAECYRYNGDGTCAGTHYTVNKSVVAGQGRPAGCPRLWCGCFARLEAGLRDPRFNRALAWLSLRHVPKQVGAYAVMRRRGGGHVGRVVAIDASGNPVILSGNHGGRVGVGVYEARRIVAYVRP